jgi:RNA 2',3'-cyclic 3'-phosphodiesterase
VRTFIAIDVLDGELVDKISQVQKQLMEAEAQVKFVEPQNLHFTFKFFGEISKDKTDEITEMIANKVENFDLFEISIKGTGVFPHLGYIRVVWLGVEDPENFSKMLMSFDDEFVKMGFRKERSYIPHLTIGRVKGAKNKDVLVEKIKELEEVKIGKMRVDKLVLKESELTPAGPIYTDLKEFELK